MPITHDYVRFVQDAFLGAIANPAGQAAFVTRDGKRGRYVASTACEHAVLWDLKTKEKVSTLRGEKRISTCLTVSHTGRILAVGFGDGAIRLYDVNTRDLKVTFEGHKSPVSCLQFDNEDGRLVSGGRDTVVILWDVVTESGIFRLKGHKGQITQCKLMTGENVLLTSSKDTYIKMWDLDNQHCFYTIVGHRSEVWDFVLIDNLLISGCSDSDLYVWQIDKNEDYAMDALENNTKKLRVEESAEDEDDQAMSSYKCKKLGAILREGRGRVVAMCFEPTSRLIFCIGMDKLIEIFHVLSIEDSEKRMTKRIKKQRKRALSENNELQQPMEVDDSGCPAVVDRLQRLQKIYCPGGKMTHISVEGSAQGTVKLVASLKNNALQVLQLKRTDGAIEIVKTDDIQSHGHRSDVRTVAWTSDNMGFLSASGETLKIWLRFSAQCIRSMDCGEAISSAFLPGDRHCIIGTKGGAIEIFDITRGEMSSAVGDAHQGCVWGLARTPDNRTVISAGADRNLKFWDLEVSTSNAGTYELVHSKTLELPDECLCVKVSPNGKYVAASLLDSTVKVFFVDTLRFFLSLYGHTFPALTLDISSDGRLMVTGSSDKTVKIWGMDFGDCHKSIFAHDDSIMAVQWLPNTHMFFSAGKDGCIKQWDGDIFQKILTLEGHQAAIWTLAVSPNGKHLLTASHDRSLRLWEKTEEIIVMEEEHELEREKAADADFDNAETVVPREGATDEVGAAAKTTIETVVQTDRLIETIDAFFQQTDAIRNAKQGEPVEPHPLMTAFNTNCPYRYAVMELRRVRSSDLEKSLLMLPFSSVISGIKMFTALIERGWEVEFCCRCVFFLLRIHSGQIISTGSLAPVIAQLNAITQRQVSRLSDMVGFNLQALNFMKREIELKTDVSLFQDATDAFKLKKKKRKQKVVITVK